MSEKRWSPSFPTHWASSHGHQTALNVCVWLRLFPQSRSHWVVNITAFCMQPASFSHSLLYILPFILSLEWSGFTSHSMKPQSSIIWWQLRAKRGKNPTHPRTYSLNWLTATKCLLCTHTFMEEEQSFLNGTLTKHLPHTVFAQRMFRAARSISHIYACMMSVWENWINSIAFSIYVSVVFSYKM